jgi:hypothetical protein
MRINDITGLVVSVVSDWKGIAINPHSNRYGRIVSWTKEPQILAYPVLVSDVLGLIEDRQYTLQIVEDRNVTGIIQLYYKYDRGLTSIETANLSFYSTKPAFPERTQNENVQKDEIEESEVPDFQTIGVGNATEASVSAFSENIQNENVQEDEIEESEVPDFQTIGVGNAIEAPVSWLRIDYAPDDTSDVIHHECHLHLSGFSDTRFMVSGLPNPKQFTELVMASFYPEIYRKHRLNNRVLTNTAPLDSVNTTCIPMREHALFHQMSHFKIPFR